MVSFESNLSFLKYLILRTAHPMQADANCGGACPTSCLSQARPFASALPPCHSMLFVIVICICFCSDVRLERLLCVIFSHTRRRAQRSCLPSLLQLKEHGLDLRSLYGCFVFFLNCSPSGPMGILISLFFIQSGSLVVACASDRHAS